MTKTSGESHTIWTLADIARLPPDARGRFMEELPSMIEGVVGWLDTVNKIATSMPEDARKLFLEENEARMPGMLTWVDDGEKHVGVTVTVTDENGTEKTQIKGNSRTRDVSVVSDGKDVTHDAILVRKLKEVAVGLKQEDIEKMLPEGKIVLSPDMYDLIKCNLGEAEFAEYAWAANRTIEIR